MLKRRPSTQFVTPHSSAQRWPRRSSAPSVFTAFVSGLRGAATPDADLFHDTWHGLRAALAQEMKRRGLWESPPHYLGVCGWERWDSETPAGSGPARAQSALGELVADCYAFIFVDRLQSLKRHLEEKPEIDGLVLLNIRHFLHERQRMHDPLGFRIFEMLQAAVEEAVASGDLHVLAGDRKIRNDTLLGFDPAADPLPTPADWERIALRWNDELMPGLVTAQTRRLAAVVRRLRELLLELPGLGVEAFRFKDLLDPLKRDARGRWATLLAEEEEGGVSGQSCEEVARSVSASIERLEADSRTRTQLRTLWHHLWRQQGEEAQEAGRPSSYRQLGQLLSIPRERLPALFDLLRQLVPR
ncbi:MAG TPA: hypothetical protein VLR69_08180 [Thermoanaerobaculia bacterium]|nr:hypothetical protein [Thermoanaerobaculia bacterium]